MKVKKDAGGDANEGSPRGKDRLLGTLEPLRAGTSPSRSRQARAASADERDPGAEG